jgi:putative ATPase
MGAEALLGRATCSTCRPAPACRCACTAPSSSDDEVHRVVEYLKSQGEPNYIEGILEGGTLDGEGGGRATARGGGGESRPDVRPGRGHRAAEPQGLDLAGAAPSCASATTAPRGCWNRWSVRPRIRHGHQRQPRHARVLELHRVGRVDTEALEHRPAQPRRCPWTGAVVTEQVRCPHEVSAGFHAQRPDGAAGALEAAVAPAQVDMAQQAIAERAGQQADDAGAVVLERAAARLRQAHPVGDAETKPAIGRFDQRGLGAQVEALFGRAARARTGVAQGRLVRAAHAAREHDPDGPRRGHATQYPAGRAPAAACTLDEVIGQAHLLGPGKPLRVAFETCGRPALDDPVGPAGRGQDHAGAPGGRGAVDARFIVLSAVLAGVKDIREAVERRSDASPARAAHGRLRRRGAPLQQGAAGRLPAACGIGPVHLHRRHHREPVVRGQLGAAVARHGACAASRWATTTCMACSPRLPHAGSAAAHLTPRAQRLIAHADGDARRLLNATRTWWRWPGRCRADRRGPVERTLGEMLRRYDKGGDQFYDTISALHKSVRGSDPDAALYWLARMLDGGADPRYVARRCCAWPARTSAWPTRAPAPGARCGRGLRAAGLARRRAGAGRRRWSTWPWRPSPMRSTSLERRARLRASRTAPAGAHAPAQRADAPDEGPGPWPGYRYAHDEPEAFAAGETYLPEGVAPPPFYEPRPRAGGCASASKLAEWSVA